MLDIFSSAKRPFFQSTEKMNLYAIDESAYYDFASYWMKKKNIELSKDIFHSLYQQFDGHTWYLQYVLNVLYSDSQSEVTKEDLRNIICRIVQREKEAFQVIYNQLTDKGYNIAVECKYHGKEIEIYANGQADSKTAGKDETKELEQLIIKLTKNIKDKENLTVSELADILGDHIDSISYRDGKMKI